MTSASALCFRYKRYFRNGICECFLSGTRVLFYIRSNKKKTFDYSQINRCVLGLFLAII